MKIPRALIKPAPKKAQPDDAPIGAHPLNVTPDETAALRLWVIMVRAYSAITEHVSADIARHGLTVAEFGIMEALYHKGPMLLGEVQRKILVSSGGITFLVDRLTAKGLVERRNCPADRRARYAALTPEGAARMTEMFPEHAAALTHAMAGLTTGEQAEATQLMRTLGLNAVELPTKSEAIELYAPSTQAGA